MGYLVPAVRAPGWAAAWCPRVPRAIRRDRPRIWNCDGTVTVEEMADYSETL